MANPIEPEPVQRAHSSNHINPGHFGTATYDDENHCWTFIRDPRISITSKEDHPGSSPFEVVRAPVRVFDVMPRSHSTKATKSIATKHFAKFIPHVSHIDIQGLSAPSSQLHWEDEDSYEKSLLAFGSALVLGSDDAQSGFQTTSIAAYVDSKESTKIALMLLERETVAIDSKRDQNIQFPRISGDKSTEWFSDNGANRQLVFSNNQSSQESTWLGVRQASATTIFQPLLHRSMNVVHTKSSLDFNLVVTIPTSYTGDSPHADLIFDPNDPHRLAIIDIAGNWSIWTIEGTRTKTVHILYRARLDAQGSIVAQPEAIKQYDGWHKIIWLSSNGHTIDRVLVANRQSATLSDARGSIMSNVKMRYGSRDESWILGIEASSTSDEFFVLTTSHIFVISISTSTLQNLTQLNSEDTQVLASWRHNRGHGDLTLKLQLLKSANLVWLFVISDSNPVVTVYEYQRHREIGQGNISISDPILFNPTFTPNNNAVCLALKPVAFVSGTMQAYSNNDSYFKLYFQELNGAVKEILYRLTIASECTNLIMDTIILPKKQITQHRSSYRIAEDTLDEELIGFITSDDDSNVHEIQPSTGILVSQILEMSLDHTNDSKNHQPRTYDLQSTIDSMTFQHISDDFQDHAWTRTLIETAEKISRKSFTAQTLLQTASDLSRIRIRVAEIEKMSDDLENWLSDLDGTNDAMTSEQQPAVSRVWSAGSLIDLYNDLANSWISSLSTSAPDRMRVQRERVVRQVALDLYLGGIVITPADKMVSEAAPDTSQYLQADSASPPLLKGLDNEASPISSPMLSTQGLSYRGSSPSLLRRHVDFPQPNPPSGKAKSMFNDILAHLPTSSDANPENYNYNDVELDLTLARIEVMNQELDPKARRKAERLARARRKQFEKQDQIKKVAFESTTASPSIMSSQLPIRNVQSSQINPVGSSQPSMDNVPFVSMSQPVRGAYGHRDIKRGKKGKFTRQKGF